MMETQQYLRDISSPSLEILLYLNPLTATQTQDCLNPLYPAIFMTAFTHMFIVKNDKTVNSFLLKIRPWAVYQTNPSMPLHKSVSKRFPPVRERNREIVYPANQS
ncbi:uncharacterized protein Bfra_001207 [Botrytis fragariae]|uniref:Uncharacterized protein n=1 Tax=Botrytis fragariae TaxID=1964551 RepID=A0A8H6B0B6_9HELO|nr:uncharacterized protein Bfra_001207 [Botrytis fragariae]KAF5876853.1 hypothetical protein Bfra_001207 [Botrytis fragariae]